jgi:steroid delta-isomerase-like uncharacterized protein
VATTGTDLTQAAVAWVDTFNRADWDAFRDFTTPDVVYTETGTGRRVEGADALVEACQGWKAAFPDVAGTIRSAIGRGDTVALEITWEGTHDGALPTPGGVLEATGNRVRTEAAELIRFAGGRAQEVHHYIDLLSLLQQVQGAATPN